MNRSKAFYWVKEKEKMVKHHYPITNLYQDTLLKWIETEAGKCVGFYGRLPSPTGHHNQELILRKEDRCYSPGDCSRGLRSGNLSEVAILLCFGEGLTFSFCVSLFFKQVKTIWLPFLGRGRLLHTWIQNLSMTVVGIRYLNWENGIPDFTKDKIWD